MVFYINIIKKKYKFIKKKLLNKILVNTCVLLKKKQVKFVIYIDSNNIYTTQILCTYACYLLKNLNYSLKKILAVISILLKHQWNLQIIIFSKKGPEKFILKGYKIMFKGRFSNQKNQMAKTMILNKGSLKLNTLNNYVDFKKINLFTKLGTCNMKIWLLYEKIYT